MSNEPPPVKGGQGRCDESVIRDGERTGLAIVLAFLFGAVLALSYLI